MDIKNATKNITVRAIAFIATAIAFTLLDEYLKEGYVFRPDEIFIPLTHENITLILTVVLILITAVWRRCR
jgi:hypothetical protein